MIKTLAPLGAVALLLGVWLAAGCSTVPNSASFASVVIAGRTPEEIQQATMVVFQSNGYAGRRDPDGRLIFEREANRASTIARDGFAGAQAGAVTLVRVKLALVDLGGGNLRLQGQTYMVSSAGDSFFEDEHRLANFRSGPYQKLLEEVAQRLK